MLEIGRTDAFEREYTQKFRNFAGGFGEFVAYERDRAARDLGLHLTRKLSSGKEQLTSALCWFQLKGLMKGTLNKRAFEAARSVTISLKVRHLQFWYLQPMPTYLALHVESADMFLVLNLQDHITERWGRGILDLKQKEISIDVPCASVLDRQAFALILQRSDVREWAKALETDTDSTRLCRRDYDLIWHIGTATRRKVRHRMRIVDWQSKTRGEVYILQRSASDDEWTTLRGHWQYLLSADGVRRVYPYLTLHSLRGDDDDDDEGDEDNDWEEEERPSLDLGRGEVAYGKEHAGELIEYLVGVRLNRLGRQLFASVRALARIGLVEINEQMTEFISVAPWHHRSV